MWAGVVVLAFPALTGFIHVSGGLDRVQEASGSQQRRRQYQQQEECRAWQTQAVAPHFLGRSRDVAGFWPLQVAPGCCLGGLLLC